MIARTLAVLFVGAFGFGAEAQDKRATLDGIYSVPFGTKLDEAREKFGPARRESEWVSKDNKIRIPTITYFDPRLLIGDRPYFVTYYFGPKGMLAAAFVSKFESSEEDNLLACFKASLVMKDLVQRYDSPDSQRDIDGDLHLAFAFNDGSEIRVRIESDDHDCEMRVAFQNADGKKLKLFEE